MAPVKLRIKMGRGRKPKVPANAEAAAPALAAVSHPLPHSVLVVTSCCICSRAPILHESADPEGNDAHAIMLLAL